MAIVEIPVDPTDLFSTQTTTLDGVPYLLTLRYNSREACYYLQIQSVDATTTYSQGIKLVSNYPLLGFGVATGYAGPPGELMCQSFSTDDSPARLGDIGSGQRCTLFYIEEADMLAGGSESWRNPDGVEGL